LTLSQTQGKLQIQTVGRLELSIYGRVDFVEKNAK